MTRNIRRTFEEAIVTNTSPQNQAVATIISKGPESLVALYHITQVHNSQAFKAGRLPVISGQTGRFAYATSGVITAAKAVDALLSTYNKGGASKTDLEILGQRSIAPAAFLAGTIATLENTTNFKLDDIVGKPVANVIRIGAGTAPVMGALYSVSQNLSVAKSSTKKN